MRRRRLTSKNKGRTVRRIGLLVLGFVLVAGIVTAAIVIISSAGVFSRVLELPFGSDSVYQYTGSGFLYTENNKLNYYDIKDENKNYSVDLSASDVSLAGSSQVTAVYNNYAMQIVGAEFPIEFSGRVLKVKCGESYAAVLKEENGSESLQVFGSNGKQVDRINFSGSFPADFGFYGSGSEILWTLTMETAGSEPVSTITTYDLSKSATTGVVNLQSHLVEKLVYSENSIFAADTNELIRFDHIRNNETWSLMIYGWRLHDSYIANKPYFLLTPRKAASLSTVKLIIAQEGDMPNETESIVHLPTDTIEAFLCSGKLIAVTPGEIVTYSDKGKEEESFPLEITVEKAVKLDSSRVMLQSGSKLYIVAIK
jgi:hypothetical protein